MLALVPITINYLSLSVFSERLLSRTIPRRSSNNSRLLRLVPVDELLWSPSSSNELDEEIIYGYLKTIRSECKVVRNCLHVLSCLYSDPTSDDEISLQTLLQCQWDTTLAVVQFRQLPVKTICKRHVPNATVVRSARLDSYREWSSDETQLFEEGIRDYGKNFHKISVSKVRITLHTFHLIVFYGSVQLGLYVNSFTITIYGRRPNDIKCLWRSSNE